MKVPLLDLKALHQPIRGEILAAIESVIDSGSYILGEHVEKLERNLASYLGAKHVIAVSSGTDALLVALMAIDVGPGDLVLTSPFSFFATAGCIARLGATPTFVDIDPGTYNLCPAALERWFAENPSDTARVKAIIPVHLFGQTCDLEPILEIAKEYGIKVIEDAAQAVGSKYTNREQDQMAGTLGDIGCFSFFPSKNLGAMGDGGAVVTNDELHAERLRILRSHGSKPKYYHSEIGGNFRLDAMQAAILIVKLKHLESWHAARRVNALYYDENLHRENLSTPVTFQARENHIYNQYVIGTGLRDELRIALHRRGVSTEIYYPVPFHQQSCFSHLGYLDGDFPVSEQAARTVLALPVHPNLTRAERAYVCEQVNMSITTLSGR